MPEEITPESEPDITLPSLSEPVEEPGTELHFGQHISRPPVAGEPEKPPTGADAVADAEKVKTRKRRSFQERVDSLVRQRHEAEEEKTILSAQIQQLLHTNEGLRRQLENFSRPDRSKKTTDELLSELGGGSTQPAEAGAGSILPSDIEGIIGKALRNYDQERRMENAAVDRLQTAQRQSYLTALDEFPELGDPRSQAGQLFARVWDSSTLRGDPNGPYQVALMIRGLMADETPVQSGATEQRKQQASVIAPQSTELASTLNFNTLKKQYSEALKRFRDTHDPQAYALARKIQAKLRNIQ